MLFSPLLTESSSPSGFRIQVDFSRRTSMGGLMIRTPAGKGNLCGPPPAPEQCSISKAGKRIGPKPHAFSSGPVRWQGEQLTRALRPTEIVILQRERTNTLARDCENGVA